MANVGSKIVNDTSYSYDGNGRLQTVTNAIGRSMSYEYDETGSLVNLLIIQEQLQHISMTLWKELLKSR